MYSDIGDRVTNHIENIQSYIEKYENKIKGVELIEITETNLTACVLENYNDLLDVYVIVEDFITYGTYKNIYVNSVLYDEYVIFLSSVLNGIYNTRININNIFNDITNTIFVDAKIDKNKSDYDKFIKYYNMRMTFDFQKLKITILMGYKNIIKDIKKIHVYYIEKILKMNDSSRNYVM